MRSARKLRIVEGCPQPDPPPFRPIQYGFAGGHKVERLPAMPTAQEISIRARAQSLMTRDGKRAELPDYETALRIIAAANRPKRVTVPADKSMPAVTEKHDSPSRAVAAGFYSEGEKT